jgi:hypothetical protein
MMMLPKLPRSVDLTSFWLTISLFCGLIVGILFWISQFPHWFVSGWMAASFVFLPGLLYPHKVFMPYKIWNKAARFVAHVGTIFLQSICFYVIFFAVGRAGSRLIIDLPMPQKTMWCKRRSLEPATYFSQYAGVGEGISKKGWLLNYVSWAVKSGNLWAWSLLPFLILLSVLETDKEESISSNIYTLY